MYWSILPARLEPAELGSESITATTDNILSMQQPMFSSEIVTAYIRVCMRRHCHSIFTFCQTNSHILHVYS